MGVCCCLETYNSVVYMLVMGLVLGPSLMFISITGILLYAKVSLHRRWRCALSPSGRSFLALQHNDKITGLQLQRRHFTTATPFRVYTRYVDTHSADRTCCCQSPFPSLQLLAALTASLVSYGVVMLRISHNEFHYRTSFSHHFCLELLLVAPIIL